MLDSKEIVDSLEAGSFRPLEHVFIKRDKKPETLGELNLILAPENTYVSPDWCTVLALPEYVEFDGIRRFPCLSRGDRVFVRPSNGFKFLDSNPQYQYCLYADIEAVEKSDGLIEAFDGKVLVRVSKPTKDSETISGWFGNMNLSSIKSDSGLFIPESTELTDSDDSGEGIVENVGDFVHEDLSIGDKVFYKKDSSPKIKIKDIDGNWVNCVIVREQDIMMVVSNE